jgi:hypothetical protein
VWEDSCGIGDNENAGYQLKIFSKQDPRTELFDKPILVTQGFDASYRIPGDQFNFDEFKKSLNRVFENDDTDLTKLARDETSLLKQLYDEGYDIVLLLWKNPGIDIRTNALVTLQALRWLQTHTEPREGAEPVIIGPSMGGLVTRYALQWAGCRVDRCVRPFPPSDFSDIRARLLIAFDSPNRGAEIPMSIQALASYFRDLDWEQSQKFNNLTSVAARQMLLSSVRNVETGNHDHTITDYEDPGTAHGAFMEDINGAPFRAQIKNITHNFEGTVAPIYAAAIINGSGQGIDLDLPPDFTYGAMTHFTLDLFLDTPTPARLTRVFSGDRIDKSIFRYFFQEPVFMENTPGGLRSTYIDIRDALDKADYSWNQGFDHRFVNHAFIPSISGAGLPEQVVNINDPELWYRPIGTHCDLTGIMLCPFGTDIFDEFRAPERNQRHVTVTSENKNWFLELIRNRGPQNAPGVVTPFVDRAFCAVDPDGGNFSWAAEFGYFNSSSVEVTIPVGPANRFTGPLIEQNEGQPVTFLSGRHQGALVFEFGGVTNRGFPAWTLAGTTVVPTILPVPQRCAIRALPQQ